MRSETFAMGHEIYGLVGNQIRLDGRDTIAYDSLYLIQSPD